MWTRVGGLAIVWDRDASEKEEMTEAREVGGFGAEPCSAENSGTAHSSTVSAPSFRPGKKATCHLSPGHRLASPV